MIKKILSMLLAMSMILTLLAACNQENPAVEPNPNPEKHQQEDVQNDDLQEPVEPEPEVKTAAELVVDMIDAISSVDFETEASIESAYIAYCALSESEKAEVSNYDKLATYRDETAKLYDVKDRSGDRIDYSKLLIGVYCVNTITDDNIKAVKDCGMDFITGGGYNNTLFELCEKYDLGVFLSYLPGWYGGDGSNAGGYANAVPAGTYAARAESFVDNPVIWAMDVGDEPNLKEFPHYGVMIDEAKAAFSGKQIYLNLYPNYASIDQLGGSYSTYINEYVENVNTDYICYDHYMYASSANANKALLNYFIVHNAAVKTDRDFWIVLQVNSTNADTSVWTSEGQISYQAYLSLAFGAKVIHWACWEAGWYWNNVVNGGVISEQFDKLKNVNTELKTLSPVYMRYTCKDVMFLNCCSTKKPAPAAVVKSYTDNMIEQNVLSEVSAASDSTILMSYFEKNVGDSTAFMFTNITEYNAQENNTGVVKFKTVESDATVIAYNADGAVQLKADSEGYYTVTIENAKGVFVTVE